MKLGKTRVRREKIVKIKTNIKVMIKAVGLLSTRRRETPGGFAKARTY